MTWDVELATKISGGVRTDEISRWAAATDFGRVIERTPLGVVRPASSQDVCEIVKFAGDHSMRLAIRGAGHSQNGRSLSDQIVLDLRGLDRITNIDVERRTVTCQAGATWRALLDKITPLGLSPPVLTNNLDVTVGGTLSTGGLGVASWRYGTQADQCSEVEVITGDGRRRRCSPVGENGLFEAVRAGLGQFGVITEVTLKLRKHTSKFHSAYLLYDNLPALLGDLAKLMAEERFDYLESWCVPVPQGFSTSGGVKRPCVEWFYPLHCTLETDGLNPEQLATSLAGLSYYRHTHTETGGIEEFFTRLDPLFGLWKAGGFWEHAHPWVEGMLPWSAAASCISALLERIPPSMLTGGHILLWPARGRATSVPLLMRPATELVLGFGILPAVPPRFLPAVLPTLREASRAIVSAGGKRYASGWLDFDRTDWEAHYGPQLPRVERFKREFDPKGVFGDPLW
ncbi:MAG: FAD-binding oxidoreductase [Terriglobia bacterium]